MKNKNHNINLLTILTLLLMSTMGYAQSTISGSISDNHGNPLGFANIFIENTFDGTSSNDDGTFSFTTNATGNQVLVADFLGYEQSKQSITIQDVAVHVDFVLKEVFNKLKAVTVTAGAFEASDEKKVSVLKPLDIVTTAGAMGDISNALQTLPGTTTVGESGRLFVRGGSSDETQTYIDGMHVPVAYTSGTPNTAVRGRFNPFMFKGTVFNTGGYSAEYGQALSSVLLLNTNDFEVKERIDISLMTIGAGLSGTKIWDKTAITASLDYTNLTPYFKIVKHRFKIINPWESINGAISFRQKTGKTGMFKLYATKNNSKSGVEVFDFYTTDHTNNFDAKNDNLFINGSWKGALNDKWLLKTGISYTKDINDNRFGAKNLSNTFSELHYKINTSYFLNPKLTLKMGGEQFHVSNHEKIYEKTINDNISAGFVEANIYLSQKLVLRAGGRVEYVSSLDKVNWSPRFSTAYKVNDQSQFSFAAGKFYQNPMDKYRFQTRNLDFESANHYILNYQIEKNKRLIRTEVYYKSYQNLFKFDSPYDTKTYRQNGNGYATGLDVFYRDMTSIKNSKFWISYSYLISERDYLDFPNQATPDFVAKHHVSLVYKY